MGRIFIALALPPQLTESLAQWQADHQNLPVRWIAPRNWHVTLVPPWEESDTSGVVTRLKAATINIVAFDLKIDGITLGPTNYNPRMIWATGPTPPELVLLKQTMEQVLGITPAKRPLKLHITLARFREPDFQKFPQKDIQATVNARGPVNSFVLLQSQLLPTGAEYQVLERFLL